MPKYDYVCPSCGHTYSEVRDISHPQFKTKCNVCLDVDYQEAL